MKAETDNKVKPILIALLMVVAVLAFFLLLRPKPQPSPPLAATVGVWEQLVALISAKLDEALKAYKNGDAAQGKRLAETAYFELFEGQAHNMEVAIRSEIGRTRAFDLESLFLRIRRGISEGAPLPRLEDTKAELVAELLKDARALEGSEKTETQTGGAKTQSSFGDADAVWKSLLIILREGIEAILIVGAITAFLIKAGARDKIPVVVRGVVAAVIASLVTAALMGIDRKSTRLNSSHRL